MSDRRYHIVFNGNSGGALALGLTAESLGQMFEAEGLTASIDADSDAPLDKRIERALADEAEIIVAAGGDGTATALASALVDTDKTLAVLPVGTANLLARDLAIPIDLKAAIAALGDMEEKRIDVAEVNGRIFLHNVNIGVFTGIAVGREQIRGRSDLRAKIGFVRYFVRRLARSKRIAVEISPQDSEMRVGRVQAVAVANNAYDEGFGQVFSRQRLDGGHLSLYTLTQLSLKDVVRLTAGMFLGRWSQDDALHVEDVSDVTIRLKKETVSAMIDGEVESLTVPLVFKIRPLALSVLAPVEPEKVVPVVEEPELLIGKAK